MMLHRGAGPEGRSARKKYMVPTHTNYAIDSVSIDTFQKC